MATVTYLDLLRESYASIMKELDENERIDKNSMYYKHFKSASIATFVAGAKYIFGLVQNAEKLGHPPAKAAEKALGGLGVNGLTEDEYAKIYQRLQEVNKIITDCQKVNGR